VGHTATCRAPSGCGGTFWIHRSVSFAYRLRPVLWCVLKVKSMLINQILCSDFAVAAPFASGGGAVYIYKGGKETPTLLKKIIGHEFSPSIQGFGYSFSRPVDVDDNTFNGSLINSCVFITLCENRAPRFCDWRLQIWSRRSFPEPSCGRRQCRNNFVRRRALKP
jgi:hypothetical protein